MVGDKTAIAVPYQAVFSTLLFTVYKLASSAVAARLKIISPKQTGFSTGSYMAESTKLMYDLMHYTETKQIPGLLMLINFEKDFDSVSWQFLYKIMAFYGFEDNFINWIKLFSNNINAYVLQAGFLSKPIAIQRECRQGGPILPYLFLMLAEVLNLLIERNTEINGLKIGKNMFKLTQFADDTTIILDGSVSSLQTTLNVLEIF